MKRILIVLLVVFSLLLSSCDLIPGVEGGGTGTNGSGNNNGSGNGNSSDSSDSENNGGNGDSGDSDDSDGGDDSGNGGTKCDGSLHTDSDNDGTCDGCYVSVLIELDFFVINDLHGKFTDGANQPGIDELTTYLKNAYETEENVFLLSSGDMWQGGSESNLTKGIILTDWMNELDFISMTLGNHEFDWGEEHIENNAELAEFPILAINVFDRATNSRVSYADASVVIEKSGVKIGIIGAIGDCYSSISSDKVTDVYFKTGSELTALVKAESERLRADGVDIIVYSLHDGYGYSGGFSISDNRLSSYYDPSLSKDGYVDIVFEGHTHQNYVLRDSYGVYHFQNGGENKGIAHAEIMFNIANEKHSLSAYEIVSSATYSKLEPDPLIAELLEKYADEIAVGNEVLGYNSSYRDDSELEQLVADLYLEVGLETWGDDYNIFLGGGFLRTRSPYNLAYGEVKYSDLQMLFPFENQIVLCSIKGSDLKSKFLETDDDDYYISKSSYGNSISSINASATYYVVVDTYTANYEYNNLTIIEYYDTTTFASHLLAEYVKSGGLA